MARCMWQIAFVTELSSRHVHFVLSTVRASDHRAVTHRNPEHKAMRLDHTSALRLLGKQLAAVTSEVLPCDDAETKPKPLQSQTSLEAR